MSAWLFIFGRTQELAFHELATIVDHPIMRLTSDVARVEDPRDRLDPQKLMTRLGGTVKIAREKGIAAALSPEALAPFLLGEDTSFTFGVSCYGEGIPTDHTLLRRMKETLEAKGIHARYVAPKEGSALSSVVVDKQHVRELIVVRQADGYIVGETVSVQDFEAWNARDYGRPFADPKAGMLPPKVARMAVNLAGHGVLLDPFCGMGTILTEALLTGWNVYGSDQSAEVVEKSRKNIEWLQRGGVTFFVSDATHVSEHIPFGSIDAIVTEPFLGRSDIQALNIRNIIKGLEKLYIGCLKDWRKALKHDGKVVIALPEYAVGGKTFFVKNVIDRCENLGYTVTRGPLLYSRPQALVRRKFFVLQTYGSR